MKKPPEKPNRVLADLHTHPVTRDLDKLLESLSWGITGLAVANCNPYVVSYDDVVNLPNVEEIDTGLFAKVSYNGHVGYIVRTQEVMSNYHIDALGCRERIEDYPDARKVVQEIRRQEGVAILNHPYLKVHRSGQFMYADTEETEDFRELCEMVDEIEVHNGQCIWWLRGANEAAKKLVGRYSRFKGVAASDAHSLLSQMKTSGIYIPEEGLSFDALVNHIRSGNFERREQYISLPSFVIGHVIIRTQRSNFLKDIPYYLKAFYRVSFHRT